jgi:iron(III) transport system ATP-binding protein
MLKLEGLVKTFRSGSDTVRAVDDVSLEVDRGELLVLLGPSGCGKTTLLRCIAGLESADVGRISFDEDVVFEGVRRIDRPPNKRNIGMVFQSYALWPHKTVRKNIAYPLTVRGMKQELNDGWVEAVAELVDCGHLLDRYPGQLSGGQQQRIALARGLVARPDVLLFDEPLSNLDALLRSQVRNELHELHERLEFTGVYVTHDQSEALALGDRLAIMRTGSVEQIGTPHEVYENPVSEYAAHFVGFANRIVLRRGDAGWVTESGDVVNGVVPVDRGVDVVHLRFRPEFGRLIRPGEPDDGHIALPAKFVDHVYAGAFDEFTLWAGAEHVTVHSEAITNHPAAGSDVILGIPAHRARWFSVDGAVLRTTPSRPLPTEPSPLTRTRS